MSSSGLIYAVIVGAWAAYLVPMWLRRQDELNEIRPTERFSTAIRLLSGRAAMERRIARALDERGTPGAEASERSGAAPVSEETSPQPAPAPAPAPGPHPHAPQPHAPVAGRPSGGRAALLARRRRMVTLLFVAFTLGMVVAAVGGLSWLWAPGIPAILFTLYIAHLRRQERRRYEVRLDRRRAAEAAQRLRERAAAQQQPPVAAPAPSAAPPRHDADHRRHALVEAADHDEWVDGLRHAATDSEETWDPVPLPLPTYVTAPVAPRSTPALDLNAPDAWSAGRAVVPQEPQPRPRTPLFDQYADDPAPAPQPRPRAANE